MPEVQETSRDRLILKLNEVYHDLENRDYDHKHPDILEDEIPRWRRMAAGVLAGTRSPCQVLDIGSGTGFVPLQIKQWLRSGDRLTCSDISAGMLGVCRANLEKAGLECELTMLKLDGRKIDMPDHSQDLVTANAVMHHLPKPEDLCREIDRILKPGGLVLVGHEPSGTHADRSFLVWSYWLLLPIADFKQFCYEIILRLGWFEFLRRPLARFMPELKIHNDLLQKVNDRLLASGIIDKPLPADTLSSLLDAQSPNAGGTQKGRGFSRRIFSEYFPGYRIEQCETYNHLDKINARKPWMRRYGAWLAKRYPEDGSNISCSLRKPV